MKTEAMFSLHKNKLRCVGRHPAKKEIWNMKTYQWQLKNGISRTPEFEKKGLAQFAVNCGLKCGHGCTYCSTAAMIRTLGA